MALAYLALGSNLGNREANLRFALDRLPRYGVLEAVSGLYRSMPWGVDAQPDFLNAVVGLRTGLRPPSLLRAAKLVERECGRRPGGPRWGPRVLDIDLLWWDGETVETADLTVPHPRAAERPFVLLPWAELAPDLPLVAGTVGALARVADAAGVERLADPGWERSAAWSWLPPLVRGGGPPAGAAAD